jgi:transcription factor C subunit 3
MPYRNQNAAGGTVPRDTFQDAAALEEILTGEGGGWQEWSLCANDGDATALVQLVSDNKVETVLSFYSRRLNSL